MKNSVNNGIYVNNESSESNVNNESSGIHAMLT